MTYHESSESALGAISHVLYCRTWGRARVYRVVGLESGHVYRKLQILDVSACPLCEYRTVYGQESLGEMGLEKQVGVSCQFSSEVLVYGPISMGSVMPPVSTFYVRVVERGFDSFGALLMKESCVWCFVLASRGRVCPVALALYSSHARRPRSLVQAIAMLFFCARGSGRGVCHSEHRIWIWQEFGP